MSKTLYRPPPKPSPKTYGRSAHDRFWWFPPFDVRGDISPREDALVGWIGIATILAFWCGLTYGGLVSPSFLPTPTRVSLSLRELYESQLLFPAIGRSLWRATQALSLVLFVGIPVGALMGAFAQADALLRKLVVGARGIPIAGGLALITLWFATSEVGKITFLFMVAVFYLTIQVRNAVLEVNKDYLQLLADFGANRWQIIWRALLPGALPRIWESVGECFGLVWVSVLVIELIQREPQRPGLGTLLYSASSAHAAGDVFAVLGVFALIDLTVDYILRLVHRKFLNW